MAISLICPCHRNLSTNIPLLEYSVGCPQHRTRERIALPRFCRIKSEYWGNNCTYRCSTELSHIPNLIAVDIPSEVNYHSVAAFLSPKKMMDFLDIRKHAWRHKECDLRGSNIGNRTVRSKLTNFKECYFMFYPKDNNGNVLRRMAAEGKDLTKARNIDFTSFLNTQVRQSNLQNTYPYANLG